MPDKRAAKPWTLSPALYLASIGLVVWSALQVARHALVWLRRGYWPEFRTIDLFKLAGWPWPATEWAGVQRMIDWVMLAPAAGFLLGSGLILSGLAGWRTAHEDTWLDEARREKLAREWDEKSKRARAATAERVERDRRKEENRARRGV